MKEMKVVYKLMQAITFVGNRYETAPYTQWRVNITRV